MTRVLCASVLAACGGAATLPAQKPPHEANDGDPTSLLSSLAAAQGGLSALGGNGNREDGPTGIEVALEGTLRAVDVDKKSPLKLDGLLREWPARVPAGEMLSGRPASVSLGVNVLVDDAKLYVAAEVLDTKLARTAAHPEGEDHVSMVIAFPESRGSLSAYEIGLWPGKPGESAGVVRWKSGPLKGKSVAGAAIVEADQKGGYTFEAAIPWASFSEARTTRVGLRAAFHYHDASGVLGTGGGSVDSPGELAPLPTSAETAVVEGLLTPRGLAGTAPQIDVYADVAGDERKERISVFGHFFTICGPGYRAGHQFFWRELRGDLVTVDTRDLEGRGKDDLVVRRRLKHGDIVHELLEVWGIPKGDEPITLFSHEIAIADAKRRVTNGVRLSPREIEVTSEPANGWDAASFSEPSAEGGEPILLPWGRLQSHLFRLKNGMFTMVSEAVRDRAPTVAPVTRATRDAAAAVLDPPRAAGDSAPRVIAAYLVGAGKDASTKPRFDLEVHVDGDARAEHVMLFGRDLVIAGAGFKDGSGWTTRQLNQFAKDTDIAELTARDLTGDGAAEILVRGIRRVKPARMGEVEVDGIFVFQVKNGFIGSAFAIETSRAYEKNRVQDQVVFTTAGKLVDIVVTAGSATGWTASTYPWPEDKTGGTVEPLLLPWGSVKSRRYRWNGSTFAP